MLHVNLKETTHTYLLKGAGTGCLKISSFCNHLTTAFEDQYQEMLIVSDESHAEVNAFSGTTRLLLKFVEFSASTFFIFDKTVMSTQLY